MQVSARSYLTAGMAVLGAGAMALSPVQPIAAPTALSPIAAQSLAVNLAASIDPITPIINTVQTSIANVTTLISDYFANPLPILQQVVNNWMYYFTEIPDFGAIISQVFSTIPRALQAPFDPGTIGGNPDFPDLANGDYISTVPVTFVPTAPLPIPNIDITQKALYGLLPTLAPDFVTGNEGLLNFLNTPISGVVLGLLGPVIAPFVALGNGISGAIAAFQASDITTAINDLINIPTNMINAALNGTTLDLTGVLGGTLPPEVTSIGLALGGLLTTFTSPDGATNPGTQVGGVGLDSLAVTATVRISQVLPPVTITDPGIGIGLVGGLVGLTRQLAGAINNVPTAPAPAATRRAQRAAATAKPAAKAATARSAAAARHAK